MNPHRVQSEKNSSEHTHYYYQRTWDAAGAPFTLTPTADHLATLAYFAFVLEAEAAPHLTPWLLGASFVI